MKVKFISKIQSGALQFTVFIAVVIALFLSGMLLYAHTYVFMKEQSKAAISNIQYANTGIKSLLIRENLDADTASINLSDKEDYLLQTHLSQWGVFQKGFARAQHRTKHFTKIALIGAETTSSTSPTLFLEESNNPLVLVGNTRIKGIAYLPSQGVRPGYIAGESYYGTELVYGTITRSTFRLPLLTSNVREHLTHYADKNSNGIKIDRAASARTTVNSFNNETMNFFSADAVVLENTTYKGNITIKSDTLIRIQKTAKLFDVILTAPTVIIEDGVTGRFQVIATSKISVGKGCKLDYPSALVLIEDGSAPVMEFEKKLSIGSASIIKGSVCFFSDNAIPNYITDILLENGAIVRGQVYCEGNFEIMGTVSGSVYTKQFIANRAGSIYVNHIYNATIENENMPDIFGGILLENSTKTIVEWLY